MKDCRGGSSRRGGATDGLGVLTGGDGSLRASAPSPEQAAGTNAKPKSTSATDQAGMRLADSLSGLTVYLLPNPCFLRQLKKLS
jgi:hypothetical protein